MMTPFMPHHRFFIGFALVCWLSSSFAEPDSSVRWLMNRPMSLFDWGIASISARLKAAIGRGELAENLGKRQINLDGAYAKYDRDENRIYLRFIVLAPPQTDITEENCRFIADEARKYLLAPDNFGTREEAAIYFLNGHFGHEGGSIEKDRPADIGRRLANITLVKVNLGLLGIECFGTLSGTDINIKKIAK
jgi:hypothetical protein